MAKYAVYLCGPTDCPNDPAFEHDGYYGCVPKNFSPTTGRSRTHKQTRGPDGLYRWNGGCDTAPSDSTGNRGIEARQSRRLRPLGGSEVPLSISRADVKGNGVPLALSDYSEREHFGPTR